MKEIISADGRVEFAPDPRDQFVRGMNEATCGYAFDRGPGGRREGIPYTPEEEADLKTYYDAVDKTWLAAEVERTKPDVKAFLDGAQPLAEVIEGCLPNPAQEQIIADFVEKETDRAMDTYRFGEGVLTAPDGTVIGLGEIDIEQPKMRTAYAIPLTKINVNVTISPETRAAMASMGQPLVWTLRGTRYYASDACSTFMLKRQGGYWKLWISGHKTNAGYPELWYAKWGIDRLRGIDFREVRP